MQMITSILGFLCFVFIAAMHFYWAVGGQWGAKNVLPQKENDTKLVFKPSPFITIQAGFAFLLVSYIYLFPILDDDKIIIPNNWKVYVQYSLLAILCLRAIGDFKFIGFTKRIKSTQFAKMDTKFFTPLVFILAILHYVSFAY